MTSADSSNFSGNHGPNQRAARLREIEDRMRREIPDNLATLRRLVRLLSELPPAGVPAQREQLGHAAHRLRGRAGMLQLAQLCEAAACLEQASGGDVDALRLERLLEACQQAYLDATNDEH
jgi:HPt (histidine-containing phosphotransfer) domain-containing protein